MKIACGASDIYTLTCYTVVMDKNLLAKTMRLKILMTSIISFVLVFWMVFNFSTSISYASTLAQRVAGKILLQVEDVGQAWYVNPVNNLRYYLGRPADAFQIMRDLGLGITNSDLAMVEIATGYEDIDSGSSTSTGEDAFLSKYGLTQEEALSLAETVRESTVCLMFEEDQTSCSATGWIAGSDLVASCGHCAPHAHEEGEEVGTTLWFRTLEGAIFQAEVLEISSIHDLAIFRVTSGTAGLPPALPTGFVEEGDPLLAVGHPSGIGTWVSVIGVVLEIDGWGEGGYTADLPTKSGMSGSPAVNRDGEVVGIVSGSISSGEESDPFPLEIVTSLEAVSPEVATVESGTEMMRLIEAYK